MKNLFTIAFALVIMVFVGSSCSSKYAVMKRHYNKGYYVENASAKHINNKTDKQLSINRNPAKQHKPASTGPVQNEIINERAIETPDSKSGIFTPVTNDKRNVNKIPRSINNTSEQTTHTPIVKDRIKDSRIFLDVKNTFGDPIPGDPLSLFWIIILVILILWVFGFASGGWGIGGLINLLLLIALILLILWLLKVV